MIHQAQPIHLSLIPRGTKLLKRLGSFFSVVFLLVFLLYGYYTKQDSLDNFKFAYIQEIYIPSLSYKLDNIKTAIAKNGIASVIGGTIVDSSHVTVPVGESAKSVPVLVYHGVVENGDGSNILINDFKEQMFALKKAGWQTITLEDFSAFMRGEKQVPDKSFLLTFDDGRKDSYYPVDPLLEALDYNAIIFVISEHSLEDTKSTYYLSKKELRQMLETGRWEVQAHTHEGHDMQKVSKDGRFGHYYSNKLWLEDKNRLETEEEFAARIKTDLVAVKSAIEQELDTQVMSFAFPFGDFGQNTINFPGAELIMTDATKAVYPIGFYQTWPGKGHSFNYTSKYSSEDTFLTKRIDIEYDWHAEALIAILDIGKEKPLPFFENFENYNGWIRTLGRVTLSDSEMILNTSDSSTSGSTFLDGTGSWENYSFRARIDWIKGRNVALMARYKDENNYIACNFSDGVTRIEQRVNGKNEVLVEVKNTLPVVKNDLTLAIHIDTARIKCRSSP